jgi:hypothetical protein
MKKKVTSMMLVLLTILTFAACTKDTSTQAEDTTVPPTTELTKTPTTVPVPVATANTTTTTANTTNTPRTATTTTTTANPTKKATTLKPQKVFVGVTAASTREFINRESEAYRMYQQALANDASLYFAFHDPMLEERLGKDFLVIGGGGSTGSLNPTWNGFLSPDGTKFRTGIYDYTFMPKKGTPAEAEVWVFEMSYIQTKANPYGRAWVIDNYYLDEEETKTLRKEWRKTPFHISGTAIWPEDWKEHYQDYHGVRAEDVPIMEKDGVYVEWNPS